MDTGAAQFQGQSLFCIMPCRLDQLLAPHSHYRLGLLLSRNKNPTTVLGLQSNQVKLSRALEKPAGIYTWIQLFNLFAHAGIRCSTLGLHQYSTHDYIDFPIDVNESERPITGYLCLGYYEGLHPSTKEATPLLQRDSAEGETDTHVEQLNRSIEIVAYTYDHSGVSP